MLPHRAQQILTNYEMRIQKLQKEMDDYKKLVEKCLREEEERKLQEENLRLLKFCVEMRLKEKEATQ